MTGSAPATFLHLPTEISIWIFEFLHPRDLTIVESCCRHFRHIINGAIYKQWYSSRCKIEHRRYNKEESSRWKKLALQLQASLGCVEYWCLESLWKDSGWIIEELHNANMALCQRHDRPFTDLVIMYLCYKNGGKVCEAIDMETLATALALQGRWEEADEWYQRFLSRLQHNELPARTWETVCLSPSSRSDFVLRHLPAATPLHDTELALLARASGNLKFMGLMLGRRN